MMQLKAALWLICIACALMAAGILAWHELRGKFKEGLEEVEL